LPLLVIALIVSARTPALAQLPGNPLALNAGAPPLDAYVVAVLEHQARRPCALEDHAAHELVQVGFDGRGRLVTLGTGDGAWQLAPSYDSRGRVTTETLLHDKFVRVYRYRYDSRGRATEMTGWDGKTLDSKATFLYGATRMSRFEEQLACCGSYSVALGYDRSGRLAEVKTSGHPPSSITLGYDDRGRLATVSRSQGDEAIRLSYDGTQVTEVQTRGRQYTVRYRCTGKE
jgi:YD repeat-containing protein